MGSPVPRPNPIKENAIMASTASTLTAPTDVRPDGRRERLIELGVFLLLIVPSMALSFVVTQQQDQIGFTIGAVATILRDAGLVALVLFFLWRAGESPRALGWTSRHVLRELAIGVALFVPLVVGGRILESFLVSVGLTAASPASAGLTPSRSPGEVLLALVLVVVVAIAEETIFRGYLLLRLRAILPSTALAVLAAALIFTLGHGYEGTAGALTVGAMGIVLGAVYRWRRSLVAPATMHFLLDALAILAVPLLR
jgi:membrane protease YdiL (CAAX protease family)